MKSGARHPVVGPVGPVGISWLYCTNCVVCGESDIDMVIVVLNLDMYV